MEESDMGSSPGIAMIHEAEAGKVATNVIISYAYGQAPSCIDSIPKDAQTTTTLLVSDPLPSQQFLSWYLESSTPPTPLLTNSVNSSAFFFSGNSSPLVESFDTYCEAVDAELVTPSTSQMVDDTRCAFDTLKRKRAQSTSSLPCRPQLVFSNDGDAFAGSIALPLATTEDLELQEEREYSLEEAFFGDTITSQSQQSQDNTTIESPLYTNFSTKFHYLPTIGKMWRHRKDGVTLIETSQPIEEKQFSSQTNSSASFGDAMLSRQSLADQYTSETGSSTLPLDLSSYMSNPMPDPIDRVKLASTPLLPPNISSSEEEDDSDAKLNSPLLSSAFGSSRAISVASETSSELSSAAFDRRTASISERVYSLSSISRRDTTRSSFDVPILESTLSLKQKDEWSAKLGHFNFTIEPEPYMPEEATKEMYDCLISDWEIARTEYCKHQARTLENYGPNSKAFKLTEEKWTFIDAQWRKNVKDIREKALKNGEKLADLGDDYVSGKTLADAVGMMSIVNIPHLDGKFPRLGDADIIGPMAVDPPRTAAGSRSVSPTRSIHQVGGMGWKLTKFFGRAS
jgi:hypothetical protein